MQDHIRSYGASQRWPGLLQPDVRHLQQLPVPAKPTSVAAELREGEGQASAELLAQLIRLLEPVEVRSMHLLRSGPEALPEVSQLQSQLEAAAPGIFNVYAERGCLPQATTTPPSQPPPATAQGSLSGEPPPAEPAAAPAVVPEPAAAAVPAAPPKRLKLKQGTNAAAAAIQLQGEAEVAGAFVACVAELLPKHEHLLRARREDVEEEGEDREMATGEEEETEDDDMELNGSKAALRKQAALLGDMRRLGEETMRVCQAGRALRRVDTGLIVKLLRLLHALVEPGSKFVEEDEQENGSRMQAINIAMEAALAALRVLATPDLPQQVYNEDLLEAILTLTKFQLSNNIYAFYDARFRGANRPPPNDEDEERPEAKPKSATKGKKEAGSKVPRSVRALQNRCETVLGLLAELLGVLPVRTGTLTPLARVAMQALTVEGIPLLQGNATALLVAAFKHYPTSRQAFMEDFFAHVMTHFMASKHAPRDFVCSEDSAASMQMLTAAVLQMVQSAVSLPDMDTDVKLLPKCYAPAVHWSDYFWSLCFDRLPSARAQKSDTEQDFKLILEQLLQDLLGVACLPDWPAAAVLLLRFITTLNGPKGLQHSDAHVRQMCIDMLGLVSARLHQFQHALQAEADWLQTVAESQGADDPCHAACMLLLEYLSDKARGSMAASARHFLLCRTFAEEASALQRAEAGEEELQQLLASFRHRQSMLDDFAGEVATSPPDARRLMQALVQKTLGAARQSTLLWLLEAIDPRQAPTTRAKAVKALGTVVEGEPTVLELGEVQKAVERALQDDSISVREAALELLGRHIAGNQRLAIRLFATLAKASTDSGTSVRKRAIKILWESCIRMPDFPAATEACKHVLMRASDNEESIQDMVSKVFHSLWFTPRLETGAAGASVERSAAQRAQQLAEVALAVYEAGGRAIHLPLDLTHPLVVVLRAALGFDAKGDLEKEWRAGREISQALMTAYLQAEEVALADTVATGGSSGSRPAKPFPGFPYMLSLHAFVVTDVELCMPAHDPAAFVKTLTPYLKLSAETQQLSQDEQRRGAEELLCILSVLDGILSQLPSLGGLDVREVVADLVLLVNKSGYIPVVSSGCKCLCTIASKNEAAASQLAEVASVYYQLLHQGQGPVMAARFLFVLSHLCRYGADMIELTKAEGKEVVTMEDCLHLFSTYYHSEGPAEQQLKVQEAALQAIGMLTISRPLMVTRSKTSVAILQSALRPTAQQNFKVRALANLNDLLRADEQQLLARQQEANDGAAKGKGSKTKKTVQAAAVQAQNGQGDSLSLSSGILQLHWDKVLRLATDASSIGAPPSNTAASSAGVRRQALALIETVLRGGLVAPWTAVAPLVALATDPNDDLRSKAMKLLKQEAEKRSDFLENKLPAGVVEAYDFHASLVQAGAMRAPRGVLPKEVALGLKMLYRELVQPNKALRTSFLQNLLKRFDAACQPAAMPSTGASAAAAAAADLPLLRFCAAVAAELPYKRGDEPCLVVHQINSMVARRGPGVLEDFKAALQSQEESGRAAAAEQCRASLALSLLLVLKDFLKRSYSINAERIAAFGPTGDRRKQEERTPVSQLEGVPCHLDKLDLDACSSDDKLLQQYKVFKKLMSQDAADYDHLNHAGASKRGPAAAAAAADGAAPGGAGEAVDTEAGTPDWVMQNGPATKKRGRKLGTGTGGSKAKGAKGFTATTAGKAAGRKKRKKMEESDDEEADEDYTPTAAKATKKRLNL